MMKKVVLAALFAVSTVGFSQENEMEVAPVNEVRVNLVKMVLGVYPEVSYERYFSDKTSVGVTAGVRLGNRDFDERNFHITPNFRWYFDGSTPYRNFYVGASASLLGVHELNPEKTNESRIVYEHKIGGGMGMEIGWKYVNSGNWTFDVNVGIGKYYNSLNSGAYPVMGLNVGKRF